MAKSKTKKKGLDAVGLIVLALIFVCLILTIVGVCINWTASTVESGLVGASKTTFAKLGELLDAQKQAIDKLGAEPNADLNTMAAFAYLTVIVLGVTTLLYLVTRIFNVKLLRLLVLVAAAAALVCAVIAIITAYTYCNSIGAVDGGSIVKASVAPAAGVWLLGVGGVLGGACGIAGAVRK